MFTVYALFSPSFNKIYIGFSSDLAKRIQSHNVLASKGYTIRFRPWRLVYTETYSTKAEAMKREKELKSAAGRTFVWKLIQNSSDS